MFRLLLAGLIVAGLAGFGAAAPAPPAAEPKDPDAAVLVLKGKDFLVHAVPGPSLAGAGALWGPRAQPSLMVLHTSIATGQMKRLMASGQWSWPGPPMGMSWIHHQQVRIAGIAGDSHRLYVLRWQASWATPEGAGRRSPAFDKKSYHLLVFRPTDGKRLHELELKPRTKEGERAAAPAETSGKGPLRVVPGSVSCLGVTFRFAGEKFLKRESDR